MPSSSPCTPAAAAARARTVRLFVDGPGKRVLFAEAGEDAAALLSSLLAKPVRAAVQELLREDPASAAAGCFANLAAAFLPRRAASTTTTATTSSSSSRAPAPPPASAPRAPKGMRIMARRLFRCAHLGCRCSDVASWSPGSACPCASPPCARDGASARRDTELHFLEACFYRRPDGSAATGCRGAGRSGDAFYRCRARDERRGRDILQCRFRVTDERGVECALCGGRTTVAVQCVNEAVDGEDCSFSARTNARRGVEAEGRPTTSYAVMDDLAVTPVAAGLSGAALLSALGIAADPADVREETVPFGYKEGLDLLVAALRSKTALTDVFLPAVARSTRRRRR